MAKAEAEGKDTTNMKIALQWPEIPSLSSTVEQEEAHRTKELFDQNQDLHSLERLANIPNHETDIKNHLQEEEERIKVLSKAAAEASKE